MQILGESNDFNFIFKSLAAILTTFFVNKYQLKPCVKRREEPESYYGATHGERERERESHSSFMSLPLAANRNH